MNKKVLLSFYYQLVSSGKLNVKNLNKNLTFALNEKVYNGRKVIFCRILVLFEYLPY